MKILHVLSSPHLGGAEVMCLYLAQEQTESGHQAAIHFLADGDAANRARALAIPVRIAEPVSAFTKSEQWQTDGKNLLKTVSEFQPDIVHSHVPRTHLICARALPGKKVWVATAHGSWKQFGYAAETLNRPFKKFYQMARHAAGDFWTLRRAAGIAAISNYVKRELGVVGVPSKKISVIYNGLPFAPRIVSPDIARQTLNLPTSAFIIGSLGHFAPVKGFDILIDAFAHIAPKYKNAFLVIAGGDIMGDTSIRRSLENLITHYKLNDKVLLLNRLDDLSDFYSSLDLFVVASRTEGFSLALVEAMQYGKASVVTSAGGCIEAARPGQESLTFRRENRSDLSAAIERLMRDDNLRLSLGKASRERARNYLTLARCAAAYEQFYLSILGEAGSLQNANLL